MIPEEYAKRHSSFLHGHGEEASQHLIHRLQLKGLESILEIGCGTGATLVLLKKNFPELELTGIDISPLMLKKTKQRLKWCGLSDVNVVYQDKEGAYPFEANTFDIVLIESVLGILPQNEFHDLVSTIKRILKKNGRLAMNETIWTPSVSIESAKMFNQKCLQKYGVQQAPTFLMYNSDWLEYFVANGFKTRYHQQTSEAISEKNVKLSVPIASRLYDFVGKLQYAISTRIGKTSKRLKELSKTDYRGEQYLESYVFIFDKA